nr:hypothetical protein B0A51_01382 [Rachicladosporium sp. CCFEE 5018]
MASQAPLQLAPFLDEYSSRLRISSASKILCFSSPLQDVVQPWCSSNLDSHSQPASLSSIPSTQAFNSTWSEPESHYTHIFAQLSSDLKTSVKMLKFLHFSLVWKGIAVVLPPQAGEGEVGGEKVDLAKLIELGGFEPGKVRVVDEGKGEVAFAMKWDLLSA